MKIEFIPLELRSLRREKSSNEMSPVRIDCVETADKQRKGSLEFVFLCKRIPGTAECVCPANCSGQQGEIMRAIFMHLKCSLTCRLMKRLE